MLKKILVSGLVLIVVAMIGLPLWATSVLTGDTVRSAIAAQVAKAIGQPVTIGGISASAFPRVTLNLTDVRIGEPARVVAASLHLGTDLRALLSRRIEHATVRLSGARVELPLPAFTLGDSSPSDSETKSSAPVELVSIDEIVLRDVQIVSGGRTVTGDVEVVPQGNAIQIRRIALGAGDTKITASGTISDISGPAGEVNLKATSLDFDHLLAFASDFSGGASAGPSAPGGSRARQAAPADPAARKGNPTSGLNLVVSLEADRASMGDLAIEKLTGRARIRPDSIAIDPIGFGIFGGRYDGTLTLNAAQDTPSFRASAKLSGVDVAAAVRFAGSPDSVTGRLSGQLDLAGRGSDPSAITRTAKGTARIEIVDGVVKNLGLVHAVVVATSMRSGSTGALSGGSKDEPFSKLSATLNIGGGAITTNDLQFEAKDLSLGAQGAVQLTASTMNLRGKVQLSEALSQQAGRDLARYTQEQGRVTLPATVDGSIDAPHVGIDVGSMAKRAAINAATEQLQKKTGELGKTLGGLFKR